MVVSNSLFNIYALKLTHILYCQHTQLFHMIEGLWASKNSKNNNGPKIEPCGTPMDTGKG